MVFILYILYLYTLKVKFKIKTPNNYWSEFKYIISNKKSLIIVKTLVFTRVYLIKYIITIFIHSITYFLSLLYVV